MTPTSAFHGDRSKDRAMGSIAMIRYAPDGHRTS
jgi:hypothetical protein